MRQGLYGFVCIQTWMWSELKSMSKKMQQKGLKDVNSIVIFIKNACGTIIDD
jgi:hypothetical protein